MVSDLPLCAYCVQRLLGKSEFIVTLAERDCPSCELLANTSPSNDLGRSRQEHWTGQAKLETRVTLGKLNKVEARSAKSNRLHGTLVTSLLLHQAVCTRANSISTSIGVKRTHLWTFQSSLV